MTHHHVAHMTRQHTTRNRRPQHLNQDPLQITYALQLLHAGIDTAVIALWLGHESTRTTDIYQHADMSIKERALARIAPAQLRTPRGRYRPPDDLLAFLEAL